MRKQESEAASDSSTTSVRLLLYDHHRDRSYVVLHPLNPPRRNLFLTILLSSLLLTTVLLSAFLLFPSDPSLSLARVRADRFDIRTRPHLSLDLSLSLTLRVRNRDFFSLDYSSLLVSVGYRGRELGSVTSNSGSVPARATSYVDATLNLDGLEVIHDAVYLIGDLAKGFVPFDTRSRLTGSLGFFFFRLPIKGKIACEVFVNTKNLTIMHQDCHLE